MTQRFVLYHGNCWDGFGAAWAAWRAMGDSAQYIPVLYGEPPPELPADAIVVVVDFSYPRDVLLELQRHCAGLQVLDHHKTARADLEGLNFALLDMDKSGAALAWEWWHLDRPIPALLRYIEDRDLWRFALPASRAISAWVQSYPRDFRIWSTIAVELEQDFVHVSKEGVALLRFQAQQVEVMCAHAWVGRVGGYEVPIANATVFYSDVGERLCELYPSAPFAAYYLDREDGQRQWGLRSRGDFDVAEVAKVYGGGGHAGAAGFTEPTPPPALVRWR